MIGSATQWLPIIAALAAAGVLAGLLAGLLGVGGGIVTVPVLFLIFQTLGISPATAMVVATSTSLMIIVPTSFASARAHHRRGNVDLALFRRWLAHHFSELGRAGRRHFGPKNAVARHLTRG